MSAGDGQDSWVWRLAEDSDALGVIAKHALRTVQKQNNPIDYRGPLRDLRNHPTRRRLQNLLRHRDEARASIYRSMIAFAARELGYLDPDGDLSDSAIENIANAADKIRSIAAEACACFAASSPKVPTDRARDDYGKSLCRIGQSLKGNTLTYATVSDSLSNDQSDIRRGLDLDFVVAGLRLIDPMASIGEAQRIIDTWRGWRPDPSPASSS